MKKTLVALAVLAASGASMAQSTVTLYGIADFWFGIDTVDNGKTSLSQTKLDSGGVNGSRFGLRGSEDLGAGLKANFQFEQGFSIDTGASSSVTNNSGVTATSGSTFSRHSWVGLSGDFGSTRFGRTPTPYDDVSGATDAVLDSALAPMNNVFLSTKYTIRPSNTIAYYTPTIAGFNAGISYSLGEDKADAVAAAAATATKAAVAAQAARDAGSVTSLSASYAGGPLTVIFGYQTEKLATTTSTVSLTTTAGVSATSTAVALAKDSTDYTRLGAAYDLGVATPKFTYGKVSSGANSVDEYQIGVDVPFGATTLSASYATSQDNKALGDSKRSGYGIGAKYALSKRTFAYGGYESDTTTKPATLDAKHTLLAIGLQHRF
jgi:predicted porin